VQDVAATDRVAVHRRDHRFRDLTDQPVQVLDLEQSRSRGAVVAGLGALLLVAAGAKGTIARTGEADDPDVGTRPGALQALDQLVHGTCPKGIHPLRPVDRDRRQAILHLVEDVGQLLHLSSSRSLSRLG
jgi:hypothetical protein